MTQSRAGGLTQSRAFAPEPASVPTARRFARSVLRDSPQTVIEAVELLVSELATNCVRHVKSGFEVTIERTPGTIWVEVSDAGEGTPEMRFPGPDDPNGRGLQIVDRLADRWGVRPGKKGKTVWFALAAPGQSDAPNRADRVDIDPPDPT